MEYRMLGPLEVLDERGPVTLGTVKERLVLAVLLLHANEVVSRDRLIDELWGESPPPTAKKAVNVYISQLRKTLARDGVDPIQTVPGGYRLSVDADQLDAARVQQLLARARDSASTGEVDAASELFWQALALWRGRSLAGLELESVGRHEIEQLEELRLTALMDRIDCDLVLGRHEQLIGELNRLVSEYPLRERLRAQQMLALYRADRQAEALDAYQHARQTLVDDLGIEPSEALQRLQRGILAHDPALEIPTGVGARNGPAAPSAPSATTHALPAPPGRKTRFQGPRRYIVLATLAALALAGALTAFTTREGEHRAPPPQVEANSLVRLDPATGRIAAETPAGVEPGPMAVTPSSLWVVSRGDRLVSKRDSGGLAAQVGLPDPYEIASDPHGNVWVSERKPVVTWIERVAFGSGTSAVTPKYENIDVPGPAAGAVAVGGRYVWVIPGPLSSGAGSDRVSLVDLATHRFAKSIGLGGETTAIAFGYGFAWIGTYDARSSSAWVSVVTPASARPVSIRVGSGDGWGPLAIAAAGGSVWAITSAGTLVQIDPDLRRVVNQFPLADNEPDLLAVGLGALWIANGSDSSVSKLDPTTGRQIWRIELGSYAKQLCGLAVTRDAVWVAVGDSYCDTANR